MSITPCSALTHRIDERISPPNDLPDNKPGLQQQPDEILVKIINFVATFGVDSEEELSDIKELCDINDQNTKNMHALSATSVKIHLFLHKMKEQKLSKVKIAVIPQNIFTWENYKKRTKADLEPYVNFIVKHPVLTVATCITASYITGYDINTLSTIACNYITGYNCTGFSLR